MNIGPKPQIELFTTTRLPRELNQSAIIYNLKMPEGAKWAGMKIAEKWHVSFQQFLTFVLLDAIARYGNVPSPWLKPVVALTTEQIVDAQLRARGLNPTVPPKTVPPEANLPPPVGPKLDPLEFL